MPPALQLKVAYMKGKEFIPGSHLGLLSGGLGKNFNTPDSERELFQGSINEKTKFQRVNVLTFTKLKNSRLAGVKKKNLSRSYFTS